MNLSKFLCIKKEEDSALEMKWLTSMNRIAKLIKHRHHSRDHQKSCPNESSFVALKKDYRIVLYNQHRYKMYFEFQQSLLQKLEVLSESCGTLNQNTQNFNIK